MFLFYITCGACAKELFVTWCNLWKVSMWIWYWPIAALDCESAYFSTLVVLQDVSIWILNVILWIRFSLIVINNFILRINALYIHLIFCLFWLKLACATLAFLLPVTAGLQPEKTLLMNDLLLVMYRHACKDFTLCRNVLKQLICLYLALLVICKRTVSNI